MRTYYRLSRTPRYTLLFALPLLLLYEALAPLVTGPEGGVRNGADVLLKRAFVALAGQWGPVALGAGLVGLCLWLVVRDVRANRGQPLRRGVFAGMLVESAVLAVVFGGAVALVTAQLLRPFGAALADAGGASAALLAVQDVTPVAALDWPTRLMLSLGAGLYEELLFRVVLVGALVLLLRRVAGVGTTAANAGAVLVGALVFSAFHYVGPYGDPLEAASFTFRFVAGVFFSGLFVLRGFGITAWTHALYDVFLLLL